MFLILWITILENKILIQKFFINFKKLNSWKFIIHLVSTCTLFIIYFVFIVHRPLMGFKKLMELELKFGVIKYSTSHFVFQFFRGR